MEPTEVVLAFIERAQLCEAALSTQAHDARYGYVEGFGAYRVHGYGCRFDLDSGEAVDYDWSAHGKPTFDAWRLWQYARSCGADLEQPELFEACRALAAAGVVLEHDWGFFTAARPAS